MVKLDEAVDGLVANRFPPVAASYQRKVPVDDAFAESTTVPVPHEEPSMPEGVVGSALITALTATRGELVHEPLLNST